MSYCLGTNSLLRWHRPAFICMLVNSSAYCRLLLMLYLKTKHVKRTLKHHIHYFNFVSKVLNISEFGYSRTYLTCSLLPDYAVMFLDMLPHFFTNELHNYCVFPLWHWVHIPSASEQSALPWQVSPVKFWAQPLMHRPFVTWHSSIVFSQWHGLSQSRPNQAVAQSVENKQMHKVNRWK